MRYRNMKQNVKLFVYNHLLHLIPSVELLGKLEGQKKANLDLRYYFQLFEIID
jgi:hypothetical protein